MVMSSMCIGSKSAKKETMCGGGPMKLGSQLVKRTKIRLGQSMNSIKYMSQIKSHLMAILFHYSILFYSIQEIIFSAVHSLSRAPLFCSFDWIICWLCFTYNCVPYFFLSTKHSSWWHASSRPFSLFDIYRAHRKGKFFLRGGGGEFS